MSDEAEPVAASPLARIACAVVIALLAAAILYAVVVAARNFDVIRV